jgi:hypothetical protein
MEFSLFILTCNHKKKTMNKLKPQKKKKMTKKFIKFIRYEYVFINKKGNKKNHHHVLFFFNNRNKKITRKKMKKN